MVYNIYIYNIYLKNTINIYHSYLLQIDTNQYMNIFCLIQWYLIFSNFVNLKDHLQSIRLKFIYLSELEIDIIFPPTQNNRIHQVS